MLGKVVTSFRAFESLINKPFFTNIFSRLSVCIRCRRFVCYSSLCKPLFDCSLPAPATCDIGSYATSYQLRYMIPC